MDIVTEMFAGVEGVDETLINKAKTLVEAVVADQVATALAAQESANLKALEEKFDQAKETHITESEEKISAFLDAAVLSWANENAVAIDNELKVQIAEGFLNDFKNVFEKANIQLPEPDASAAVTALQTQIQEAETAKAVLAAQLDEAQKQLDSHTREKVLTEAVAGLAVTQADRIRRLSEGFATADFKEKVGILVEAFGEKEAKKPENKDGKTDAIDTEDKTKTPTNESMSVQDSIIAAYTKTK